MIKNIIFDFDGVLVDSEILVAQSFTKYLAEKNIYFEEKEFAVYAGKKTVQVIDELSQKFNIQNKKNFFKDIMNIANNIYSQELMPVKGVKNFLQENNFNYFIGSNSVKSRIMLGLKKVNFDHFFSEEKIFSFDLVANPKPYPDVYLEVIKACKLIKKETIILEYSVVGVKAGVAAGIKVVGLTAGGHWHSERSKEELIEAGAFLIVENYNMLTKQILKL